MISGAHVVAVSQYQGEANYLLKSNQLRLVKSHLIQMRHR